MVEVGVSVRNTAGSWKSCSQANVRASKSRANRGASQQPQGKTTVEEAIGEVDEATPGRREEGEARSAIIMQTDSLAWPGA